MSKRNRLTIAFLLAAIVLVGGAFTLHPPSAAADRNKGFDEPLSSQIQLQPEEVRAVLNQANEN